MSTSPDETQLPKTRGSKLPEVATVELGQFNRFEEYLESVAENSRNSVSGDSIDELVEETVKYLGEHREEEYTMEDLWLELDEIDDSYSAHHLEWSREGENMKASHNVETDLGEYMVLMLDGKIGRIVGEDFYVEAEDYR